MVGAVVRREERETLAIVISRVERRLGLMLALLVLGIVGILGGVVGQPVVQYLTGSELEISAGMEGAACGSHLEWQMESREVQAGSRITVINDSTYWQIPVVIERAQSDGSFKTIAESPVLRGGERWTQTLWRGGTYRIVSADQTQRAAGLETTISVE